MVDRIHGNQPHPTGKQEAKKEIYSRELHEQKLATLNAFNSVIDDVPNYKAYLQSARGFDHSVTRSPKNKSAGLADHLAEKTLFKNKAYMTRIAPALKRKAPF